jgi:surface antigen
MNLPLTLAMAALVATGPALADPPAHAPAHGHYKKHKHDHDDRYDRHDREHDHERRTYREVRQYEGRSGVAYVRDYGVASGRCHRDEIGTVLGGVTGAVVGSQIANDNRAVGMVVGGVLGAVVGHAIGDSMDRGDRACMGHALELGRPGVPVAWSSGGHRYHFTPRGDASGGCRHATLVVDGRRPRDVLACPSGRGEWTFRRS